MRRRSDNDTDVDSVGAVSNTSFGSAIKWSVVMNGGRQGANIALTFVLARLLGPTAFGLVAIAMVFVAFIEMVMQQGIGAAIVQRPQLNSMHLTGGFWLVMLSAAGLSIVAFSASDWWADVNGEPDLGPLVRGLTPLLLLRGLIVVPDAVLRRNLEFRVLAFRTNVSAITGGIVGILAALAGAGVWSLVYQQLSTAALEVIIVWGAVAWRPRLSVSREAIGDLFGFSWRNALAGFGVFVNNRADALIIGLVLGPTTVGLYRFASRLVGTVLGTLSGSLSAVSLPEFARLQADPDAVRNRVMQLQRVSAAAAAAPLAALAAASPALVEFLGSAWGPAAPAIAILAFAGVGKIVGQATGPLLQALGYPGRLAFLTWIAAGISSVALLFGTRLVAGESIEVQVVGLALIALVLSSGIFLAINLMVMSVLARIPVLRLLGCVLPGMIAGGVGFAIGRAVDLAAVSIDVALVRVGLTAGAALLAAVATILALEPEIRHRVVDEVSVARERVRRGGP